MIKNTYSGPTMHRALRLALVIKLGQETSPSLPAVYSVTEAGSKQTAA